MKGLTLVSTCALAISGFSFIGNAQAAEQYITIGTGGQTGVYYVAGQSICRFVNRGGDDHNIKCNAPASGGGVRGKQGRSQRSLAGNAARFRRTPGAVPGPGPRGAEPRAASRLRLSRSNRAQPASWAAVVLRLLHQT